MFVNPLLAAWTIVTCNSLSVLPKLTDLAPRLHGTQLDYKVAIGSPANPFQMQGLRVELSGSKAGEDPSKSGASRSTGLYETIQNNDGPYYINTGGEQTVNLRCGRWEVNWRNKCPHGFLVASFDLPESVRRTDEGAVLEAGRFFIYHRVWSEQTLERERSRRKAIEEKASKHFWDRDRLVKKLQEGEDSNVLRKLKTYSQAYKAQNDYRESGLLGARFVPLFAEQVLELVPEDCIMSTRGRVFRKAEWQKDVLVREEDLLFLGEEVGKEMAYIGESSVV